MEYGLPHYSLFHDAVYQAFVLTQAPPDKTANALGTGSRVDDAIAKQVLDEPPENLMGLVGQPVNTDWSMVDLFGNHPGVPKLYSEFMEEELPVPYDPENYFIELFQATEASTIPDAPLCRLCPLTVAGELSKRLSCRSIALWSLENLTIAGLSMIENGNIVLSLTEVDSRPVRIKPGQEPEPLSVSLLDAWNDYLRSEKATIIDGGVDLSYTRERFSEIWMVQVEDKNRASSERWREFIDRFKDDMPL